MSNLSRCAIELSRSSTYLRITFLIYIFAAYILVNSQVWRPIQTGLLVGLIFNYISIYVNPFPYKHFKKLIFLKDEWILTNGFDMELRYQKMRIILDCGFFFLLELSGERECKVVVIFADQLSRDQHRILKLIEKTH
ncbi:hypothetical protein ACQUW5_02030 [Legionella sp. CNM-1927-20]|uniref:hypothetical protein n=1 Tax=Legionella sp. CNM-1927-20 TaxID=3422221 RepID=UPI00403B3774